MTHPGEKFYPEGVHWDDPIARGTLPDLLSKAARDYGTRPALEFRDRPIGYAELEAMVEVAASAFLRAVIACCLRQQIRQRAPRDRVVPVDPFGIEFFARMGHEYFQQDAASKPSFRDGPQDQTRNDERGRG